jgi:hypothetical protein
MSDEILRKALAMLRSIADELPKGDIEERYVSLYHKTLTDIEGQTDHQLDYFRIPDAELKHRVTSTGRGPRGTGPPENTYSTARYCDREMFLIKLNGALHYLTSFLTEPQKRIIGF